MAGDLIRFVDSIVASPTLRLDLNDEVSWWVKSFSAPPPRLRRSMAENAMRDGVSVGSASYSGRTLTIEVECRKSTQDLAATEIQKLWRELDRATNFLMYQPTGATKPVFFKTFRSDASQLADVMAQAAMRTFTIEVLAEPFALGLRETVGPFTVTNNPAAGSNGCFFDVTGVIGDVPSPALLINTSSQRYAGVLAVRQHGTPSNLPWFAQAETIGVPSVDTSNPGGGPDAAMSGTTANNYMRTTFATTTTMAQRVVDWDPFTGATAAQQAAIVGTYRLIAAVRRSDSTSVINIKAEGTFTAGGDWFSDTVTLPLMTSRLHIDLGIVSFDLPVLRPGGAAPEAISGLSTAAFNFYAERISGAGTLDWDCVFLVPADESYLTWEAGTSTSADMVIDSDSQAIYSFASGDPFLGTAPLLTPVSMKAAGGFPDLVPNQTNRFYLLIGSNNVSGTAVVSVADSWSVHYWPRYLFARPSAT